MVGAGSANPGLNGDLAPGFRRGGAEWPGAWPPPGYALAELLGYRDPDPGMRLVFVLELDNIGVVKFTSRPAAESPERADGTVPGASTRQRVLDLLLARGPMTAAELAAELELTTAGVRRHLGALLDCGEITFREQSGPRGRGRPAKTYLLTPSGRKGFGQAYDDLALTALSELVAVVGPDAIDKLAEKRLAEVENDYLRRRIHQPDVDPMRLLADALSAAGYFASAQGDGELCQHHCPVAHVAAHFPQLCEAETSVFARLLGTDVSRSATIASGDEACRVHLGGRTLLPKPVSKRTKRARADRKVSA